jgi:hypothetical protein
VSRGPGPPVRRRRGWNQLLDLDLGQVFPRTPRANCLTFRHGRLKLNHDISPILPSLAHSQCHILGKRDSRQVLEAEPHWAVLRSGRRPASSALARAVNYPSRVRHSLSMAGRRCRRWSECGISRIPAITATAPDVRARPERSPVPRPVPRPDPKCPRDLIDLVVPQGN